MRRVETARLAHRKMHLRMRVVVGGSYNPLMDTFTYITTPGDCLPAIIGSFLLVQNRVWHTYLLLNTEYSP